MNQRAETENRFLLKYLLIGIAVFAYGLYAAYDATIGYPSMMPRAEAWEALKADESLNDAQLVDEWKKVSEENGWPTTKRPTKKELPEHIHHMVQFNYGLLAVCLAISVPCIFWYARNRNSWIEAKDDGLNNSFGQSLKIDQIKQIDKKKWEKKGIAVVHYEDGEGPKEFVIDDLKYQRKATDEILAWVESHLKPNQIINGLPEAKSAQVREGETEPAEEE